MGNVSEFLHIEFDIYQDKFCYEDVNNKDSKDVTSFLSGQIQSEVLRTLNSQFVAAIEKACSLLCVNGST
jgi:hypothetical protein